MTALPWLLMGKKVTNSWVGDYYVGEAGKKLTNTWQDGYYLDEEGKITRNAWVGDTYLGEDGLARDASGLRCESMR